VQQWPCVLFHKFDCAAVDQGGIAFEMSQSATGTMITMPNNKYPLLEEDIRNADTIQLESHYKFQLFSVGERAQSIKPELLNEVQDGLIYAISELGKDFDTVLVTQPGGPMWGTLVAQKLNKQMKTITLQPSSSKQQTTIELTSGFAKGRKLYFPEFKPGEKIVFIDDVLSTGYLVETVVKRLQELGTEVLLALYIIEKGNKVGSVENKLGIPVKSLVTALQK
jgi:orotate phosphoribosyltransferase